MKYPDLINPEISRVGVRESQMYNVIAGQLVTDIVKTSLGPRGMEKVYIDILGEETITKHGGAFLRKIDVDHPAAKVVVDAVNAVDTHVGDGTVTAAVLIGALLGESKGMLKAGVATAAIVRGFERSLDLALQVLDEIKIRSEPGDEDTMRDLLDSCLAGKAIFDTLPEDSGISGIIMDAVRSVADFAGRTVDPDDIKIEEKHGNSSDVQLVMGTVIDKPADSPAMPDRIRNARVLLLNDPLEATRTKTDSEIEITSPSQMGQFLQQEGADVLARVRKIIDSGAGLVISRKGIDETAQEYLARAGIVSIRRAKYNDLWWLEKATGATTCRDVERISGDELGFAPSVYQRDVSGDRMLFVEAEDPKSVTILLRSASKRYLDEFHRTAKNAIFALRNFVEDPCIVCGGGSCEAVISHRIRQYSHSVGGREQLVMQRFADALEQIPLTLARNVGMNPLDVLPQLRSGLAGTGGTAWCGIDSSARAVRDMSRTGIIETAAVKEQVLKSAVETVSAILGVDDIFMHDLIDNTHCHIDGTVHAHKDPGRNHNHWEQEGLEQRQMHHYY